MGLYKTQDFKLPEVKINLDRTPTPRTKLNYIIYLLSDYNACNARDAVRIIEEHGVDKFDFDYPYGSFEEFKRHTLAGEFDVKLKIATKEDHERLQQAVKEGKAWVTY